MIVINSDLVSRFNLDRRVVVSHHEGLHLFALAHSINNPLLCIQLRLSHILLRGELDWIVPFPDGRFRYLFLQGLSKQVIVISLHQSVYQHVLVA